MKNKVTRITIDLTKAHAGTEYRAMAKYMLIDCPQDADVILEIENCQFEANKFSYISMPFIRNFKVYSKPYLLPHNGQMTIYCINCGAKADKTGLQIEELSLLVNAVAEVFKSKR